MVQRWSTPAKVTFVAATLAAVLLVVAGTTRLLVGLGTDDALTFDRFDVDAELSATGQLRITERLEVTFTEPRLGLFRRLPVSGVRPDRPVAIEVEDVVGGLEGDQLPWRTRTDRDEVEIEIGGHDDRIPAGQPVRYEIRYVITGGLATHADDPDTVQLRLDVPGDGWEAPIPPGQLRVTLPAAPTAVACGIAGRGGVDRCPDARTDGREVVQPWPSLGAFTTATVGVDLPATALDADAPPVDLGPLAPAAPVAAIGSRGPVAIAVATVGLLAVPVLLYELLLWLLVHRDRRTDPTLHDRPTPTADLEPPDGLGPVDLAHLLDRRPVRELVLAQLLHLERLGAVRSRLEADGTLVFNRGSGPEPDTFDHAATETLLPRGRTLTIPPEPDAKAKDRLEAAEALVRARQRELVAPDGPYGHTRAAFLRGRGGTVAGVATIVAVLATAWLARDVFRIGAPIVVVAVLGVAALQIVTEITTIRARLPLDSRGRDLQRRAAAFEHYLAEVEADRIEWSASQDGVEPDHPALRLLPYAVALGMADSWYERFGHLLAPADGDAETWWQDRAHLDAARHVTHRVVRPVPGTGGGGGSSFGGGAGGLGGGGGSGIGGGGGGSR